MKKQQHNRRSADDIMHSLRELAAAIKRGAPLHDRFTVRKAAHPGTGRLETRCLASSKSGVVNKVVANLTRVSKRFGGRG